MCVEWRERERGNRIKQQQKPSQQQKGAKKEAEGGTAGGGLGLKRGGEGKRTRRRWGAEEEEEEWGQNWFAFFSLPLSPNRTQSLRDPEGRGGTKRKREREADSQGRTEGRKEGRKRGQCWLCVARCLFPFLLPRNRPLFPPCSLSVPKLRPPLPFPPFFCHKPFLPSFHFSSSHLVCNIRGLLRPRPKKGGRGKRKRKSVGEIFGAGCCPPPFWEGGAKMGGGSGFDPRRATLQRRRRENTRKGGKGGGGRGEQGSKLFCAPASPSLLFLSR